MANRNTVGFGLIPQGNFGATDLQLAVRTNTKSIVDMHRLFI